MNCEVDFSRVEHLILNPKRVPWEVTEALQIWVEMLGIHEVRKEKRYRDHALKGQRAGERSITLSYQWRAIYTERHSGELILIRVEEVTPHDYRKK